MQKYNINRSRHAAFLLHVHLVFVTKYRRKILGERHHAAFHQYAGEICRDFGAELKESFSSPSNFPSRLMSAGVPFGGKDGDGNINKWNPWYKVWSTSNAKPDTNGNLKVSSPVVDIHSDGTYQLTREAEGVTVKRIETGKYRISGCNGFAKDGAWGIHGGTIVPANSNGLNLIWVCESRRVKSINSDGEVVYYNDGELCDIPDGRVINVRVQLLEKSQE